MARDEWEQIGGIYRRKRKDDNGWIAVVVFLGFLVLLAAA